MSTSSIMHSPTTPYATGAIVAAIAAGALAISLSGSPSTSVGPSEQDAPSTSHHFVWHPTTSGGRVMIGQ